MNSDSRIFEDAVRRPVMQRAFLLRCEHRGNVMEGGRKGWMEGGADDLLTCSHDAVEGLWAESGEDSVPHSDAAGQHALHVPL